ncbi:MULTISPECIES: nitronate monooxygenase [unclassified Iodidimonas]|jgi:enoyl-[acyl-carrier protein] reductase II|uniref:NAD(P)H-dependent flavin oxidoreductase n=1 Tax=unclassified Iodidimonas TaxID=2626145 RepID=UPI002482B940|nr:MULTISPECIES: nitronate monooxygenase [unclassified Iodidimonas]
MPLKTPICNQLKIDHPILLAGMGGVSYAELCAAVSNAGGYGTLGMAMLGPDDIRDQMRRVRTLTDKPFGVDLLTALPQSLTQSVDVIIEEGASSFIAGLGVPTAIIERLHEAGLLVMSMCGKVDHAKKAEDAGVDIVIAQGTEAGGHTGKVAGMALIPQIVDAVSIPVLGAGGIVDGRGLAAALALGAAGVWMGTRFIASSEAHAGAAYKNRLITANEADTIVTRCYSGKPMRVVQNAYVADWENRPQDIQPFPMQAMMSQQAGVLGGIAGILEPLDIARDCLPAGQGTGAIHDIVPAAEIIRRTMAEAEARITEMHGLL